MTIWGVRAGRYGEREGKVLEEGYVFIGWGNLSDLLGVTDSEHLRQLVTDTYLDFPPKLVANYTG